MNGQARLARPDRGTPCCPNVLFVHPNGRSLAAMIQSFTQAGIEQIEYVHRGDAALAALRNSPWSIVVLDLSLRSTSSMQLIDLMAGCGSPPALVLTCSHTDRILHAVVDYARSRGLNAVATTHMILEQRQIPPVLLEQFLKQTDESSQLPLTQTLELTADEVEHALISQQIRPYFQPQHLVADGCLRGAEVLARWHRPDGTILGPSSFIPAFERAGLLDSLTSYMLSCAIDALSLDKTSNRVLAVNVPASVASSPHWAQSVADLTDMAGIDRSRLIVEVTEDGGSALNAELAGSVAQLRMLGFHCAIDDFGNGDSTLERLMCSPFDEIKISRDLIARARHQAHVLRILSAMVSMALQLDTAVVAEGMEDEDDLLMIQELGCTITQGYVHAHPMSLQCYQRYLLSADSNWREVGRCVVASTSPSPALPSSDLPLPLPATA